MLAKANRILRGADFRRVARTGRRVRGGLSVVYRAKAEADFSRFGFVVSKQVGRAVVRNRVKRRLSAIVREHLPEPVPSDVVIRALPGAGDVTFVVLRAEVSGLLERR